LLDSWLPFLIYGLFALAIPLSMMFASFFLYPLAVILHELAWFGFMEFLFFIVILALAYVYIWRKGALEWR
jgi:NADH:ubiquinone oxidoreductase subunit 3 (subunit A)